MTERWGYKDTDDLASAVSPTVSSDVSSAANTWLALQTFNVAPTSIGYKVSGTQVVGARRTGWSAPTGTATRTSFATSTVTLPDLAERVKAIIDDLTAHGLIGT